MRASSLQTPGGERGRTPWPVLGAFLATLGCYQSYGPADDPDAFGPRCGNGLREPGEQCDDGNRLAGDGCEPDCRTSCQDDGDCDDALTCTSDRCVAVEAGRSCRNEVNAGWCRVDGTCHLDGAAAAGQPCLICRSEVSREAWSPAAAGTSCEDGLFCNGAETCDEAGACRPGAPPCGTADCTTCDEARGACDVAAAGTTCRPAEGSCDVAETCDGRTAACPADGFARAGASCDDGDHCTMEDACDGGGRCVGDPSGITPPAPSATLPRNGVRTGSPFGLAAADSLRPRLRWNWPDDGCPMPSFEVQFDDSCPATGFADCAFPSPEATGSTAEHDWRPDAELPVEEAPPVGRRYFFRLRACRASNCSGWTPAGYVDVGRAWNDFNGDGYSDLALAAPGARNPGVGTGRVYIFHGGPAGAPAVPSTTLTHPTPESTGFPDGFGATMDGAGDVNADGFADLVVGVPIAAAARVCLGSAAGLADSSCTTLSGSSADPGYWRTARGDGDLDADGCAEVAIGAPGERGLIPSTGAVHVFFGDPVSPASERVRLVVPAGGYDDARFGEGLALTDLNGDRYADVVVGATQYADRTGLVFVFTGTPSGVAETPLIELANPLGAPDTDFGAVVAAPGDVDGDTWADLVVAAPLATVDRRFYQGISHLYRGGPAGAAGAPSAELRSPNADEDVTYFGLAVAGAGDLDGDGRGDLLVGQPHMSSIHPGFHEGLAFVFSGVAGGISTAPSSVLALPAPQPGSAFGRAVGCVGDVDGDGRDELAVGAPGFDGLARNEGLVVLFRTDGAGGAPAVRRSVSNPDPMPETAFGWAFARAGCDVAR